MKEMLKYFSLNVSVKVQQRAASLDNCPWCSSKGLTYALRSYRINLQESITLCTNPQCLFPLVSRSLEDILASLVPAEPTVGIKRKNATELENEDLIKSGCKRLRSSEHESVCSQSITDRLIGQTEHSAVDVVSNGERAASETDGEKVNGFHKDSPVAGTTGWESLQDKDDVLDKEPEKSASADGFAPPVSSVTAGDLQSSSEALSTTDCKEPAILPHSGSLHVSQVENDVTQVKSPPELLNRHHSLDSNQSVCTNEGIRSTEVDTPSPQHNEQTARMGQKSLAVDLVTCKDTQGVKSETDHLLSTMKTRSKELVPVPDQLFWKNSNNLCWLDSMLVALVNCKTLRKCKPKDEPQRSSVWQLMRGYEDICAAIQVHQQLDRDGVVMVPKHVLQKANTDLQSLRMSVFKRLQPKLHCKLGQRETPVFALPLLLTMDSWVEPLFQSTFHWEFNCSECKTATKERVMKTLPTVTNILPDWSPLHAVHLAPCNICCKKNQRRTMMLESVPPVFVLHFVDGLPNNDVRMYTFTFKGKRHSVTTVIQYNQQLKHFVTWVSNSDGSWLEYDDLKHPDCKTHQTLPVPAEEIHVVFWEVKEDAEPPACSSSSTYAESPASKKGMKLSTGDKDLKEDEMLARTPDHSLLMPHNDTDIVCALSATEDSSNIMDTTVTAGVNTSIGSTTLLDAFEGLTHNDIITLTLVELKADSEMQPVNEGGQTQDTTVPSKNETLDSTPDSSSAEVGGGMSHSLHAELPTTSNSKETEDDSSAFPPSARRGRRKGREVGKVKTSRKQMAKKAALSKDDAPNTSPPAFSEATNAISCNSASAAAAPSQDSTTPVETTQQALPVSSTNTTSLCTSQESTPALPTPLQNSRLSFLLSKRPLQQVYQTINKVVPLRVTQVKPTPPTHSTPNPVRKHQIPGGNFPRPQLKTEQSEGLPLKAAEMYDGFGAKSSNTPSPLPFPAPLNATSKLLQPVTSTHQKVPLNATGVSGTSLPTPAAMGLPEISSSKKHSSQSSKIPPGLSETEILRYKLIKKLKAKKKKLAKLNEMLGHQGGASLRPDSTDLGSPNTVTSSTYEDSVCDDFLSDLLSPATTASNLSPDSTGFLEMLANGQDGVDQTDSRVSVVGSVSQVNPCVNEPSSDNFLDDFLSQAVAQRPTEMETEALSALELFI